MQSSIKHVFLAALAVLLLGAVGAWRYVRVEAEKAGDALDGMVPMTTKVAALKNDIKGLDKPISEQKDAVAARRVEVQTTKQAATQSENTAAELKAELKSIKREIDAAGSGEGAKDKKARFTATFARFEQAEARQDAAEKSHTRAVESLATAEKQLAEMEAAKSALLTEVADLEAALADAKLAETRARTADGESEVNKIKARLADLKQKAAVRKERANLENPAPVAAADAKDYDKAVREFKARGRD